MKKQLITLIMLICGTYAFAQIDKEQLALDVAKADAANIEKLEAFIWKRHSTATVDGEVKATIINEVSFDENGEIQVTQVDADSNVKQKRGIRGKIQQNAIEDNVDYVEEALKLSLAYTYMSKGQLLDFFEKAEIHQDGNTYVVTAKNVYAEGDKLVVVVEKDTKLFVNKTFSGLLDQDPIDGEIKYEKFSTGISHGSETVLNLPAKNAVINAKNQDYSQRIK